MVKVVKVVLLVCQSAAGETALWFQGRMMKV